MTTNDVTVEKFIDIDENAVYAVYAMQSVWSVSKLSTESVGSRRDSIVS